MCKRLYNCFVLFVLLHKNFSIVVDFCKLKIDLIQDNYFDICVLTHPVAIFHFADIFANKHVVVVLKDAYLKLKKNRKQKVAFNIRPKKKWIYENAMSFIKLELDDESQKELKETYKIVDIKAIKMDKLEENYEEAGDDFIKSDSQDDQLDEGTVEYLDLDMEAIQEAEEYQPVPILNSQKKRKRSKDKSPSHLKNILKTNYDTQGELKLRPKYRPIRPKPYQNPPKANKLQSLPSIVNFNPAPGFIVAAPTVVRKEAKGQETFMTSPTKGINCSKITNGANIVGKANTGNLATKSDSRNGKLQTRTTPKNSVELFFESMAKTVLNLPTQVQAEIKMEICKVISMAEIKYLSGVHSKSGKKG